MKKYTVLEANEIFEKEQAARLEAFYETVNIDVRAKIFRNGKSLNDLTISTDTNISPNKNNSHAISVKAILYNDFIFIRDNPKGINPEKIQGMNGFLDKHNFYLESNEAKQAFTMITELYDKTLHHKLETKDKKYSPIGSITYHSSKSSYTDTFYTQNAFIKNLDNAFDEQPSSIMYKVFQIDDALNKKINALLSNYFDIGSKERVITNEKTQKDDLFFNNTVESWKDHYLQLRSINSTEYEREKHILLEAKEQLYYSSLLETAKNHVLNIQKVNPIVISTTENTIKLYLNEEPRIGRNFYFNRRIVAEQAKEHDKWNNKVHNMCSTLDVYKRELEEVNKIKKDSDYVKWLFSKGNTDGKYYASIKECYANCLNTSKNNPINNKINGFIKADKLIEEQLHKESTHIRTKCF